jgi:hypothetical protein
LRFFGRQAELELLDGAFSGGEPSVVTLVGPGGQGKTAIIQHWLRPFAAGERRADGVFLWSFYRGKDGDLCLRQLYAYALGADVAADVSATYCVDHLLPILRRERWVLVFDGTEVAQYESGDWFGRFVHPELGRLLQELASAPMPGVVLITSRFPLPEIERRRFVRPVSLGGLDRVSARNLLTSLGVSGPDSELDAATESCGAHAKAVELLGTFLTRFHGGDVVRQRDLPEPAPIEGASAEEQRVARILAAYQAALAGELQDILALATAYRDPPSEAHLLDYLASEPVRVLLHQTWGRSYVPFKDRAADWLQKQVDELVALRLLERVAGDVGRGLVIDAHPLVRRGFEHVLGAAGRRQSARARAGFLRGRPDRRRPASLSQAREDVEMFHAYCDAALWNEADGTYVALENPKHRFLAPAFERDLLLRFFPAGDWSRPPLWSGFGRYRSLAICQEMLGRFDDAITIYRPEDAPLTGDALIALGRLEPLLEQPHAAHPWQSLWSAYRAHALALAGRTAEAIALARSLVPVDVYEWVHVFECLLRLQALDLLDLRSVLYRPPHSTEHHWAELARRRLRLDWLRMSADPPADLATELNAVVENYDRGGLPFERGLTRLSQARWLIHCGDLRAAESVNSLTLELARQHSMAIIEIDALAIANALAELRGDTAGAASSTGMVQGLRAKVGYHGPPRP